MIEASIEKQKNRDEEKNGLQKELEELKKAKADMQKIAALTCLILNNKSDEIKREDIENEIKKIMELHDLLKNI